MAFFRAYWDGVSPMVRLNRRVGNIRDTYLLCGLRDRVMMIPEQVRRKLDAGQGHIVGQVAVYLPVEPIGQIRAAQVEAGSKRGKGQVLLQMQVDIVDDMAACLLLLALPVKPDGSGVLMVALGYNEQLGATQPFEVALKMRYPALFAVRRE